VDGGVDGGVDGDAAPPPAAGLRRTLRFVGFVLLGPVEAWSGPVRVAVGSPRQCLLLAVLAADAGLVVPVEVLLEWAWSGHQVNRTLSNRVYLGELSFRETTVTGTHDPIVDPAVFDQAQTQTHPDRPRRRPLPPGVQRGAHAFYSALGYEDQPGTQARYLSRL
jgi:hypothetical protein